MCRLFVPRLGDVSLFRSGGENRGPALTGGPPISVRPVQRMTRSFDVEGGGGG